MASPLVLRFLAVTTLVTLTLLGAWLASSLIAFAGGPAWLALLGAVVLFPVLPLWWEKRATDAFYAHLRQTRRLLPRKRPLTAFTRVALRTVALNLGFVALLLVTWPKVAFAALATRGDWFLDGRHGAWAERGRQALVATAGALEWLHRAANDNPYRTRADEQQPVPDDVKPTEVVINTRFGEGARWRRPPPTPTPGPPEEAPAPQPDEGAAYQVGQTSWPWPREVHPVVAGLTPGDEVSLEAVARTIAARVTDPFQRVKALHDWVVTRLRYDERVFQGQRGPQDPASVFAARTAVCEGYARLLVELGRLTGDHIVYVTGESRDSMTGALAPVGHAWNAVELQGAWYLLDATWDDPLTSDHAQRYETDYLFIPPQVMALNHFPDDARWQLLPQPLSRAEFLRQPLASPGLAREQLELTTPRGLVVPVTDELVLRLKNPARRWVMVEVGGQQCGPRDDEDLTLTCPVTQKALGATLFVSAQRQARYDGVARFRLE